MQVSHPSPSPMVSAAGTVESKIGGMGGRQISVLEGKSLEKKSFGAKLASFALTALKVIGFATLIFPLLLLVGKWVVNSLFNNKVKVDQKPTKVPAPKAPASPGIEPSTSTSGSSSSLPGSPSGSDVEESLSSSGAEDQTDAPKELPIKQLRKELRKEFFELYSDSEHKTLKLYIRAFANLCKKRADVDHRQFLVKTLELVRAANAGGAKELETLNVYAKQKNAERQQLERFYILPVTIQENFDKLGDTEGYGKFLEQLEALKVAHGRESKPVMEYLEATNKKLVDGYKVKQFNDYIANLEKTHEFLSAPGDGHCQFHSAVLSSNPEVLAQYKAIGKAGLIDAALAVRKELLDFMTAHREEIIKKSGITLGDGTFILGSYNEDNFDALLARVNNMNKSACGAANYGNEWTARLLALSMGQPITILDPSRSQVTDYDTDLDGNALEGDRIYIRYNGFNHYDAYVPKA